MVPGLLGKASRLTSLWPPERGTSSCATPGCVTSVFLGWDTNPGQIQTRGKRSSLGSRGQWERGGILDGEMGNHAPREYASFQRPNGNPSPQG